MLFFLFFFLLPTCEGKCCCWLKTSKQSCFSLQSLQTSFKWTGASFDSGGAAAVVGRLSLLLIISATVNLLAVKQDGRPSRRQGQLMMTRDDLRLLTSCHSCPNGKNLQLLDSKVFGKRRLVQKQWTWNIYISLHAPQPVFALPLAPVLSSQSSRERCDFRFLSHKYYSQIWGENFLPPTL